MSEHHEHNHAHGHVHTNNKKILLNMCKPSESKAKLFAKKPPIISTIIKLPIIKKLIR
jgi:hypothetical protein